jgi:hypothetical protein
MFRVGSFVVCVALVVFEWVFFYQLALLDSRSRAQLLEPSFALPGTHLPHRLAHDQRAVPGPDGHVGNGAVIATQVLALRQPPPRNGALPIGQNRHEKPE